jgi:nucleoid DNA-binding protein
MLRIFLRFFSRKEKAKRSGRNPATGKILVLGPRKVVTFKWSGKFKEILNTKPKTKKRRVKSTKKY